MSDETDKERPEFDFSSPLEAFKLLSDYLNGRGNWTGTRPDLYLKSFSKSGVGEEVGQILSDVGDLLQEHRPEVVRITLYFNEYVEGELEKYWNLIVEKIHKKTKVYFYLVEPSLDDLFRLRLFPVQTVTVAFLCNSEEKRVEECVRKISSLNKSSFNLILLDCTYEQELKKTIKYLIEEQTDVSYLYIHNCSGYKTVEDVRREFGDLFLKTNTLPLGIRVNGKLVFSKEELVMRTSRRINELVRSNVRSKFNRSKLMIVGEGEAGKSSTVDSLLGKDFNEEQDSTRGFELKIFNTSQWEELDLSPLLEQIANQFQSNDQMKTRNHSEGKRATGRSKLRGKQSNKSPHQNRLAIKLPAFEKRAHDLGKTIYEKMLDAEIKADVLSFSLIDMAGQVQYYTQHHLFLSEYSSYLLVFDLPRLLSGVSRNNSLEFLRFWGLSIKLHAPQSPVYLVGTHYDELENPVKSIKEANKVLNAFLMKQVTVNWIDPNQEGLSFFPVDNKNDKRVGIPELRNRIETVTRLQPYVSIEVPISFLFFFDELSRGKRKYFNVNSREITTLMEKCNLKSRGDLEVVLRFLNERGLITYFAEPLLHDYIVIDPQWIVNGMSCIVFDDNHHKLIPKESLPNNLWKDRDLFKTERVISRGLLDHLLSKYIDVRDMQFFRDLLMSSRLMCPYPWYTSTHYLVPPLFNVENPLTEEVPEDFQGPMFVIDFSGDFFVSKKRSEKDNLVRFIPYGLFERFVCVLVERSGGQEILQVLEPVLNHSVAEISLDHLRLRINVEFYKDRPLWMVFRTVNGTSYTQVLEAMDTVVELFKMLEKSFFSGKYSDELDFETLELTKNSLFSPEAVNTRLALSCLVPSASEASIETFIEVRSLQKMFGILERNLKKSVNARTRQGKLQNVKLRDFEPWLILDEE